MTVQFILQGAHKFNQSKTAIMAQIQRISFHNPQYRREELMHALPIAQIGIQLAKDEQDIQEHSLRVRLSEVEVLWHAAIDILLNLGTELFVLTDRRPWRLVSHLSYRSDHARQKGDPGTLAYVCLLAQRVGLLLWVLEMAKKMQSQRVVG